MKSVTVNIPTDILQYSAM